MDYIPYICFVKFICSILAFVILMLSVQPVLMPVSVNDPCCITDDCCSDGNEEHNPEKDCKSGCNPFQVCGCSAFCAIIPKPIVIMPSTPAATVVQWGVSSFSIADEPASGFWQPPRAIA